ncbi:hypothetical protein Aple_011540 [Acrocarpospora pleiomorpha]|uniref:Uncharacterized protein n=1 Tax=Acrocarpospora pleiomorpha TaxID=90975 RepID=A0A5M3XDH8_9ACTN|nr:hypothetical protein [Acrocarpospora pleiomorpha]GES18259.1 hypothetical protein Aple_011540 [Acrocarpospora pleiomorpha]
MPKVSPRAEKIFGRVPTAVNLVGSALLITQVVVGISLAVGSDEPDPVALIPPPPTMNVVPTPEVVAATPVEPPSPSPTPTMEVKRIPEGEIVRLKRFAGAGSPVIGQVKDKKARLTFVELGAPWGRSQSLGTGPIVDGTYSKRQTFVTEEYGPALDRQWWADIDSQRHTAELAPGESLYDIAAATLDYKQSRSFPSGTVGVDLASQPIKNGWVIVRQMRMPESDAGRKSRIELSAVAALNTGTARPGILWITIPDTHKRLWPDINRVIASVRALRP